MVNLALLLALGQGALRRGCPHGSGGSSSSRGFLHGSGRASVSRAHVRLGSQVTIHCVGKRRSASSSEAFTDAGYDEYALRTRTQVEVSTVWHRGDAELIAALDRERAKRCAIVYLDEKGKLCTSIELSELMYAALEEGGSRLSFVIGGATGLPDELRPSARTAGVQYLSLGKLTFTHQMARLVLAEQIYRATQIRAGTAYHKE